LQQIQKTDLAKTVVVLVKINFCKYQAIKFNCSFHFDDPIGRLSNCLIAKFPFIQFKK